MCILLDPSCIAEKKSCQDGGFAKVLKQQTGQPFTSFGLNVAGRSEQGGAP